MVAPAKTRSEEKRQRAARIVWAASKILDAVLGLPGDETAELGIDLRQLHTTLTLRGQESGEWPEIMEALRKMIEEIERAEQGIFDL